MGFFSILFVALLVEITRKHYNFYYTCVKNKIELSVMDFRLINTTILLLAFMSMAGASLSILHTGSLNLKKCSIISFGLRTFLIISNHLHVFCS
jgi:hypothetical protein